MDKHEFKPNPECTKHSPPTPHCLECGTIEESIHHIQDVTVIVGRANLGIGDEPSWAEEDWGDHVNTTQWQDDAGRG